MRTSISIVLLLVFGRCLVAQQCSGNLGENIFTDGDFGSGAANIPATDPGIAPGFRYQTSPPPNDGFYTITNDMGRWQQSFGSWRRFGDNSSDPNGYMMIVNASFEPGLFYEQVVDSLCENTLYQFSADISNILQRGSNIILPNVSFLIDNQEYFTTGNIPEDERWHTYGFTFTTLPGQTSVTLALRNNAPGGQGNDLALDNISFRACGPEALILPLEVANICEDGNPIDLRATINGDQFPTPALQWQRSDDGGGTWSDLPGERDRTYRHRELSSGRYYYRYLLANSAANLESSKCRIVSNTKVVNVVPKRYTVVDTICAGLTVTVGTSVYDSSGVYVDSLRSSLGCDSIVRLDLTVVADPGLTGYFSVADPSCSYTTDGRVVLDSIGGGRSPYGYTFGGRPAELTVPIDSLGEGAYAYRLEDRYGCTTEDTVRLRSPFPFTVDLGADRTLVLGDSTELFVSGTQPIVGYRWSPEGLIVCDSLCSAVVVLPPRTVTVGLQATSDDGCVASDSITLQVTADRLVYIPNAISPNGDGHNDRFAVFGKSPNVLGIVNLRIYSRWGAEVFTGSNLAVNDESGGWDGTIGGRPAPVGTYVYVADIAFLDGVVQRYSGSFVVLE
ncbi:gliding motility-associated C-terminal domain-containing protein [Lewinella sp. JB7]|uniref:gliding motility-associated C-terminal domain-containing protein n=1 Tax=Lewinella sp. JB7 TaxID=2962887 RepID=UPI0020C9ED70|nr:gliding motility-associated C-terminal domain-containing protein [Lewinella sp. JB7]MCP9237426.1 gliding motility-associated C-terminal domain-containing protein [Lewinella sp. JB7]